MSAEIKFQQARRVNKRLRPASIGKARIGLCLAERGEWGHGRSHARMGPHAELSAKQTPTR